MKANRASKAKRLSKDLCLDRISSLPPTIIESILCLVSIQEAGRTSVLSRDWRYKWTRIPKLVFSHDTYSVSADENQLSVLEEQEQIPHNPSACKRMCERCKVFVAIYQILLARQGPIQEFTLEMNMDRTCVEINHMISHLSRNNAVMKLKLHLSEEEFGSYYWIPLSIFSLQHLTNLYLLGCDLNLKPTFSGFSKLTSLYLRDVYIPIKTLLHLVSNCPLLKTFTLLLHDETMICDDECTVIELLKCLPMIENLTTWSWTTNCFILDPVPQKLPTLSLIHLKSVSFTYMSDNGLYFLAFLIRCSPNVEKIEIEVFDNDEHLCDEMVSVILKAYSDIRLEHLKEFNIIGFTNVKPDLDFMKFILSKSPKLKKVFLLLDRLLDKNEESKMLRILLHPLPASQEVEVTLKYVGSSYESLTRPNFVEIDDTLAVAE